MQLQLFDCDPHRLRRMLLHQCLGPTFLIHHLVDICVELDACVAHEVPIYDRTY
jgi:hypothetical protein